MEVLSKPCLLFSSVWELTWFLLGFPPVFPLGCKSTERQVVVGALLLLAGAAGPRLNHRSVSCNNRDTRVKHR